MCPRFIRFALRGVLPVPEKGETDKDGVLVNLYKKNRNRSPEAINYPQLVTVTVQMCPRFVRFALRGVLPVPEEGETDKDGVQVNGYATATPTFTR